MKDFFISRNGRDKAWAEWIASTLVDAGYSVVIQDWDFRPGGNFVLDMDRAIKDSEKTIVVLSDNFLNAEFTQSEWAAAFRQDPQGIKRALIPVKVRDCKPLGLLSQISYINFVNLAGESECRAALLEGLKEPGPPDEKPQFPGTTQSQQPASAGVPFPGDLWTVPYDRNNFFTGREQVLTDLRQRLTQESTAALSQTQAISGLGGIGKTQTAVEYAYRYAQDYQAVFWVRAETRTEIITEFVEIARRLELPQANAQDPMDVVNAVKRWLETEKDWLVVFDNADTPKLVRASC